MNDAKDWLLQNSFCAELVSHIFIDAMGNVRPCCDGTDIKYNGERLVIGDMTIEELAHHPAYYDLINQMENNIIPDCCAICKDIRDPLSPRISNSVAPRNIHITKKAMNSGVERTINSVHLRVGNTCNLKCRICYYGLSSGWGKDAYRLIATDKPYKETHIYKAIEEGSWPVQQKNWTSNSGLENIVSLHLSGGEPLMNDETFEMIDSVLSINNNIEVKFNTNGTFKYKEEFLDKLLTAKEINFYLSIDDIDDRFEYQRKNAKWKEVQENIKWFVKLAKNNSNVHVAADIAVSIFNVYYLPEITQKFNELGLPIRLIDSHPYDHYTRHNKEYYIRNLTIRQKEIIKKKLQKYDNRFISDVIDFMMQDGLIYSSNQRSNIINEIDKIRNESFEEIFPELSLILNGDI